MMAYDVDASTAYLSDGGLGEVIGFTSLAHEMDQPKVQMDTDMAMALCLLADEAIKTRKSKADEVAKRATMRAFTDA